MILGDLNAYVGRDNNAREDHMRKQGSSEMNENRELFADFCLKSLVIGGTIFPHKEIHKTTWTSPDKKLTKNQIDLITINRRRRNLPPRHEAGISGCRYWKRQHAGGWQTGV